MTTAGTRALRETEDRGTPERGSRIAGFAKSSRRPLAAIAVLREPVFSPGMVEHDAAILRAAAAGLSAKHGVPCPVLGVAEAAALPEIPDLVLTMAEGDESLAVLDRFVAKGALVLNSPAAVRRTRRLGLLEFSRPRGPLVEGVLVSTEGRVDLPASIRDSESVWVKRGDYHALGQGDVVRVAQKELSSTLSSMKKRGIEKAVVQPHHAGSVVKFYGVGHEVVAGAPVLSDSPPEARGRGGVEGPEIPFFRTFPTDGTPPEPAALERLRLLAQSVARDAGIPIYGGDAIMAPGKEPVIVDLNAWPSFWRCLADAGPAITNFAHALVRAHRVGS